MPLLRVWTFRVETAVIAVASVSVVALALLLVEDAVTSTQGALRAAAQQEVQTASGELKRQYEERAAFSDRPQETQSPEERDLSLRGLSHAVLRAFSDVQGGFYDPAADTLTGVAGPGEGVSAEERRALRAAVRGGTQTAVVHAGNDLLVAEAVPLGDGNYAWALIRLVGARDPAPNRRRWLLATIVLAAVIGVAGIISISVRLRRGVEEIQQTLQRLEQDFNYRPAARSDDFGEIQAAIAKMADRRMELESSLRRQDRLAALGKVVAGVAHEIRNPLNSMRLQLELLKRKTRKAAASTAEADAAMQQVDRLDAILRQLLTFGRPGFHDRAVQPVAPLVRHAASMVRDQARARRVEIQVKADDGVEADVDGVQIEQVVTNLLLNAVQVSPEGGCVEARVTASADGVDVAVADHGSGIPEEIRDYIFDAFFTTQPDGTGLGLSVSREIAAAHGGSLDFASTPGGTTFVVRLPARRQA